MSLGFRCVLYSDIIYGVLCRLYARQKVLSLVNLVAIQLFPSCAMGVNKQESVELLFLFCGSSRFHSFLQAKEEPCEDFLACC